MYVPSSIATSLDLAVILNAPPATEADARETPRDWLAGIFVGGKLYPLDPDVTTETLAVLADGTAAAEFSPEGTPCHGRHRAEVERLAAHWCVTEGQEWSDGDDLRGVIRDWRSVTIFDAEGRGTTTLLPSVDDAKAAFRAAAARLAS
ncbi:hypothetical protein ABT093_36085 [Kitasatospora sp. NPDC002551]|uniref:hypothetical protein n=1 Tax=Kitasatospora sp. NPDC002551 TaxID=3154539 RepID=UPI003326BF44